MRLTIPPMPPGFTDRAAWDAIHHEFRCVQSGPNAGRLTVLSGLVMQWQRDNQERVQAAIDAACGVLCEVKED